MAKFDTFESIVFNIILDRIMHAWSIRFDRDKGSELPTYQPAIIILDMVF